MVHDRLRGSAHIGRDAHGRVGDGELLRVFAREQAQGPVALGKPPDIRALEALDSVVWVQHEPVEVPDDGPGEEQCDCLADVLDRDGSCVGVWLNHDQQAEHVHEQVVASEWLSIEESCVDPAGPARVVAPSGQLLCPAVLALDFDLDQRENNGEDVPVNSREKQVHGSLRDLRGKEQTKKHIRKIRKCQSFLAVY